MHTLLAAVVAIGLVGPGPNRPQPEPADTPLAGPAVPDQVARTLVQRDMRGALQPVQGRPEIAAAMLLDLSPQVRNAIRDLAASRAADVDRSLVEGIDRVRAITDALRAGDRERAQELTAEAHAAFEDPDVRDPLLNDVRAVLPPEQDVEFQRILNEYWAALIDWNLRDAPDRSPPARERIERRLVLQIFQQEVREAYQRTLQPYRQRLDSIYEITSATPQQRAEIRDAVIDLIRVGRLRSTAQQRRSAVERIYRCLDEQQHIALMEAALFRS